jgi:cytoskeletal protein RodZ
VVDSFNTPAPQQPGGIEPAAGPEKKGLAGFVSTTVGKLVVGGIAIVLILIALGAIAWFFFIGQTGEETAAPVVVTSPAATATSTASAEASPTERPADSWADTFAFRNIFQPTIKITLAPEGSTDGSSDTSPTAADVPPNTLYLGDTYTVDGEEKAELTWNGSVYVLGEGETIPGTPWKVVSISGDTVTMLYGDSKVTLTVGQAMATK